MTGTLRRNPAITMLFVICLWFFLLPQAAADKSSREAVEALEAYAVYKMAMYDEAFVRFMALAEKGNQQGMLNVAGMLVAGLGVPRDLGEAFDWYRKSAQGGSAIGMFYLAQAFQHGHGTESDSAAARLWYQSASEAGSHDAQLAFARLLLDDSQTQQAIDWLQPWAASGNSGAAELLAVIGGAEVGGGEVNALDRVLITRAWNSIDRSARAGNAHGVVYFLDHRASIQVRLPGLPSWTQLPKDDLRALWQRNFDSLDQYRFSRGNLQIEALAGTSKRYRVSSTIDEVLPAGMIEKTVGDKPVDATGLGRALTIVETAIVSLIDDRLQVDEIKLDISAPE